MELKSINVIIVRKDLLGKTIYTNIENQMYAIDLLNKLPQLGHIHQSLVTFVSAAALQCHLTGLLHQGAFKQD